MQKIEYSQQAASFLCNRRYPKNLRAKILSGIEELANAPLRGKPLVGRLKGLRSLRVQDYRVLYQIIKAEVTVYIVTIAHRRESYR